MIRNPEHPDAIITDDKDTWGLAHRQSGDAFALAYPGGALIFTRRDAHDIHAWLTERLGLITPTPTAPLTASKARAYGEQERRVLIERPDGSGNAASRLDLPGGDYDVVASPRQARLGDPDE